MSIRTVLTGVVVPFALLACSASTGSETTGEQSAAVKPGPPPGLCGVPGEPACQCVAGEAINVGGPCVACSEIRTTLSATIGLDSSGFYEAQVNWSTSPAVPIMLGIQNTSGGSYVGTHTAYTPGSGTWSFPGMLAGTYSITATPFEAGEEPCGAYASTIVTTPPSSVSLSLSASDPEGDYSGGELNISQDGTWSVSGGFIQLGSAYAVQIWSELNCNVTKGITGPDWGVMIGANILQGPSASLYGSGTYAPLATDWMTIVNETSANCTLVVDDSAGGGGGGGGGCEYDCDPCDDPDCDCGACLSDGSGGFGGDEGDDERPAALRAKPPAAVAKPLRPSESGRP